MHEVRFSLASALVMALALLAAWPLHAQEVSTYIYGSGDGWELPSQRAQRLAIKKEEQVQANEARMREEVAHFRQEMAKASSPEPAREPEARDVAAASRAAAAAAAHDDAWRYVQLGLAMLVGIGIAALWNYVRQRQPLPAQLGPMILRAGGAAVAMAGTGPAAAPAPQMPPRDRGRRNSKLVPRRARMVERRRDPFNESIRTLAGWGVLPKWVRDLTPVLTDGARLAGAVTDDVQMFQMGGDVIPNYAFAVDPKAIMASAERQREATATVWSHQNWAA
jgi:hypothetical protein